MPREVQHYNENTQEELIGLLRELSLTIIQPESEKIDKYFKRFYEIYEKGNFRHLYSDIAKLVIELYDRSDTDSTETLTVNLREVYVYCNNNAESDDFKIKVLKLYDHVALETARCRSYSKNTEKTENLRISLEKASKDLETTINTNEIAGDLKNVQELLSTSLSGMNDAREEIKNLQNQVIAVLGIFSAIIIAFFGGFSYFTSIFSNLHNLHICKALFFSALLGFIMFNLIVLLLVVIAHLTRKPIYFSKFRETSNENSKNDEKESKRKEKKTGYATIFWLTNIVAILVMGVSMVLYCCNFTPKAEEHLNSSTTVSSDVSSVQ